MDGEFAVQLLAELSARAQETVTRANDTALLILRDVRPRHRRSTEWNMFKRVAAFLALSFAPILRAL
jgi:hypothetical protein